MKRARKFLLSLHWDVFLYSMLLIAALFAFAHRIQAQSPVLFERDITATPSSNTFVNVIPEEQVETLYPECGYNMGTGLVFDVTNGVAKTLGIATGTTYSYNCALYQLEELGDPTAMIELFNDSNTGLYPGVMALNFDLLQQRPSSGVGFVEEQIYALNNAFDVNAQSDPTLYYPGTGFDLLRPMQGFWGWIVNIVYGILIVIIIFVAFGIMFRAQLPGGVAITLQNSIPNIALAMVLVPLSYAITGLFIDGITIGANATHQVLLGAGSPGRDVYLNRNDEFPLNGRIGLEAESIDDDRGLQIDDPRVSWLYSSSYVNISDELGEGIPAYAQQFLQADLGGLQFIFDFIMPIVNLAIGLLLLLTGLRIFWLLFKKYITIAVVGPLTSPLVFATVAFPGNGFKSVIEFAKLMGSGTAYYVAAYGMTLLSLVLASTSFKAQLAQVGITDYTPPLLGLDLGSGAGIIDTAIPAFLMSLVAVGIYLLIPSVLQGIDSALGVENAVIPSFLAPVWQSAQDSVNMARTGAQRGVQLAGGAANLPARANQTRMRLTQSARNAADRLRGRTPGEQNSSGFRRVQRLEEQKAELERRRQNAIANGNGVQARILKTRINGTERELESVRNSVLQGDGKLSDTKPGELKVEVTWEGKAGPIILDEDLVQELYDIGNQSYMLPGGKIVLKIENAKFTPNIVRRLHLLAARGPNTSTRTTGSTMGVNNSREFGSDLRPVDADNFGDLGTLETLLNGTPHQPLVYARTGSTIGIILDSLGSTDTDPSNDMTTFELGFSILFADPRQAVSQILSNSGIVTPAVSILNTEGNTDMSNKFMFRLDDAGLITSGDIYSNVFDFKLKRSGKPPQAGGRPRRRPRPPGARRRRRAGP